VEDNDNSIFDNSITPGTEFHQKLIDAVKDRYKCECGWHGEYLNWVKVGRCIQDGQCPKCKKVLDGYDSSD
jgi:hypothetical protein